MMHNDTKTDAQLDQMLSQRDVPSVPQGLVDKILEKTKHMPQERPALLGMRGLIASTKKMMASSWRSYPAFASVAVALVVAMLLISETITFTPQFHVASTEPAVTVSTVAAVQEAEFSDDEYELLYYGDTFYEWAYDENALATNG